MYGCLAAWNLEATGVADFVSGDVVVTMSESQPLQVVGRILLKFLPAGVRKFYGGTAGMMKKSEVYKGDFFFFLSRTGLCHIVASHVAMLLKGSHGNHSVPWVLFVE